MVNLIKIFKIYFQVILMKLHFQKNLNQLIELILKKEMVGWIIFNLKNKNGWGPMWR